MVAIVRGINSLGNRSRKNDEVICMEGQEDPRIGKSIWELLKGFLCNNFGIDQ
jgi:hypothetical protein